MFLLGGEGSDNADRALVLRVSPLLALPGRAHVFRTPAGSVWESEKEDLTAGYSTFAPRRQNCHGIRGLQDNSGGGGSLRQLWRAVLSGFAGAGDIP